MITNNDSKFTERVAKIVSNSLKAVESGIFPDALETAKVVPIF